MTRRASKKRRTQKQPVPRDVVHRTAWHPIAADVLSFVLPPDRGYQVLSELQLNYQPLRADYVILRADRLAQPASPVMSPLTRLLGPYNLVELTGPTSLLQADDFRWLRVYSTMVSVKLGVVDHREVYSFVMASRLTREFTDEAERHRGKFVQLEAGVHTIEGLDHVTYCIETEVVGDHILQLLSPLYLRDPEGLFSLLSEEEKVIFRMVYDRIEQFKKDPLTALKYPDWKDIEMTTEEFSEWMLSRMSPKERIKGLSWEELLKLAPPEERLRGLAPEERLKGLPAEDLLKGLAREDRLKGLSPEAREALKKLLQ